MALYDSIVDTIGRTPIVRLHRVAPAHVSLYAKVESFNPGGSVKDRLALAIVLDANPTAGMLWQAPAAPAGCSLVADGQTAGGAGDGAGVQQHFAFTANAAGQHALRFVLQRAWEPQPQAVQPVAITVR